MKKLSHLYSLRGLAILMVIFLHTGIATGELNWLFQHISTYGQMGVQLFFLVSAFTLCLSWENRKKDKEKITAFFIRRIFRIAPIYYIGIVFYFTWEVIKIYQHTNEISLPVNYSLTNISLNAIFLHGLSPAANNSVVPGGWSIAVEMLFYLFFPLIYRYLKNNERHIVPKTMILTAITISLNYLLCNIFNIPINSGYFYFNFLNQIPVFLIGMVYYQVHKRNQVAPNSLIKYLIGFIIFTCISIKLWHLKALIPISSGISFIFLFRIFESRKLFQNKLFVDIGRYSFSIYLFHFFITEIVSNIFNNLKPYFNLNFVFIFTFISTVILSFLISKLSYNKIELPMIKLGNRIAQNQTHPK